MAAVQAPFDTPEAVLKAVRHIAVSEVASEPKVRDVLRERYYEMATVSTGTYISPLVPRWSGLPLYSVFNGLVTRYLL